ncbi:MAG: hypothetical protein ACKV1O_10740 [Saprospiraceae bacterium]
MKIIREIKKRTGARKLLDVEIPDSSWKPDFDIVDRYQSIANEMMRISLLGIAGYGFLIKEICMKDPKFYSLLHVLKSTVGIGSVCLLVCLAFSLAHRFFSTSCLYYQVQIMRGLKRLANNHWSEDEKAEELKFIGNVRRKQQEISNASHLILIVTSISFVLGFLFIILSFYDFFNKVPF